MSRNSNWNLSHPKYDHSPTSSWTNFFLPRKNKNWSFDADTTVLIHSFYRNCFFFVCSWIYPASYLQFSIDVCFQFSKQTTKNLIKIFWPFVMYILWFLWWRYLLSWKRACSSIYLKPKIYLVVVFFSLCLSFSLVSLLLWQGILQAVKLTNTIQKFFQKLHNFAFLPTITQTILWVCCGPSPFAAMHKYCFTHFKCEHELLRSFISIPDWFLTIFIFFFCSILSLSLFLCTQFPNSLAHSIVKYMRHGCCA